MSLPVVLQLFYSVMAITVMSLMGFYVYGLMAKRRVTPGAKARTDKALFYGWIGLLTVIAISFHVLTAWQLPWVQWEIDRNSIRPDREITLSVGKHQFRLPENGISIKKGETVKFTVTSEDLTYGFGVFRKDGAMEFQMQVLPGHSNEIIWIFSEAGEYSIRSTEYAGVDTWKMYVKDAIEVSPG